MHKLTSIRMIILVLVNVILFSGCARSSPNTNTAGTSWGQGAFSSNGEQIYFTATSDRGDDITYTGGPTTNGWMMTGGRLACASCHGPDGRGGVHTMGMMQTMDAKDIRWSALQSEYDAEKFKAAVEEGKDADGTQLSTDMPRWSMSDGDISDLITYLKTLP